MHGLGNDFVVLNALEQAIELDAQQVRRIAHRRFGVGCDQILVIRPSRNAGADFHYSVYNADGSEAEHCGNGIRCVARYLRERGILHKDELVAECGAGLIRLYHEGELVRVNMGPPEFDPPHIPLAVTAPARLYSVKLDGADIEFAALSMGNPHAVIRVADIDRAPVTVVGPQLQAHALFPDSVNAGFMQVMDSASIRLRVFERGVGETLACGTGACAAVVAGIKVYNLDSKVNVVLPGGSLTVSWDGNGQPVWMTGPGATVYEGSIDL